MAVPDEKEAWPTWMVRVAALVWMGRPMFLPGGALAYALGVAMGFWRTGSVAWGPAVAGLFVAETAHLAAHYANEYADVDTDRLARRTWLSGGSGVLQAGLLPRAWPLVAAILLSVLGLILSAVLIAAGALPLQVSWIVALGLAGGWLYSMPPARFERRGLGELDTAVTTGILMPLMGYTAQVGHATLLAAVALVPIAGLILANLIAIHWVDREADAAVGKRSLAVIAGNRVRLLHHVLLGAAYLLALLLTGPILPIEVTAALLLSLPVNVWAAVTFTRQRTPLPSTLAMAAAIGAAAAGWIAAALGR